jgi:hypothetical protein
MMNTQVLLDQKWFAAAGTPDAGMPFLFRATPQHGNRRADSSLGSQPQWRQGIIGTTRRHPRRYETTAARDSHSTIRAIWRDV